MKHRRNPFQDRLVLASPTRFSSAAFTGPQAFLNAGRTPCLMICQTGMWPVCIVCPSKDKSKAVIIKTTVDRKDVVERAATLADMSMLCAGFTMFMKHPELQDACLGAKSARMGVGQKLIEMISRMGAPVSEVRMILTYGEQPEIMPADQAREYLGREYDVSAMSFDAVFGPAAGDGQPVAETVDAEGFQFRRIGGVLMTDDEIADLARKVSSKIPAALRRKLCHGVVELKDGFRNKSEAGDYDGNLDCVRVDPNGPHPDQTIIHELGHRWHQKISTPAQVKVLKDAFRHLHTGKSLPFSVGDKVVLPDIDSRIKLEFLGISGTKLKFKCLNEKLNGEVIDIPTNLVIGDLLTIEVNGRKIDLHSGGGMRYPTRYSSTNVAEFIAELFKSYCLGDLKDSPELIGLAEKAFLGSDPVRNGSRVAFGPRSDWRNPETSWTDAVLDENDEDEDDEDGAQGRTYAIRDVEDWDEATIIQEQYESAMSRRSDYLGDVADWVCVPTTQVIESDDGDYVVGFRSCGVFVLSHFAPRTLRTGAEFMRWLAQCPTGIVAAVPDLQASMLERIGFSNVGKIPQWFNGEMVEKNVMVNDAVTDEKLANLLARGAGVSVVEIMLDRSKDLSASEEDSDFLIFELLNKESARKDFLEKVSGMVSNRSVSPMNIKHAIKKIVEDGRFQDDFKRGIANAIDGAPFGKFPEWKRLRNSLLR